MPTGWARLSRKGASTAVMDVGRLVGLAAIDPTPSCRSSATPLQGHTHRLRPHGCNRCKDCFKLSSHIRVRITVPRADRLIICWFMSEKFPVECAR